VQRLTSNSLTTKFRRRSGAAQKLALASRVQKDSRRSFCRRSAEASPALARADFEMVALDYFRRLGHDNHHRLSRYGWEEKKIKTSWGGKFSGPRKSWPRFKSGRYGGRPQPVCCDVLAHPHLYCPGYSSAETHRRKPTSCRTAVRYKVDASKIAAESLQSCRRSGKGGKAQRRSAAKKKVRWKVE